MDLGGKSAGYCAFESSFIMLRFLASLQHTFPHPFVDWEAGSSDVG
jgi:hypothetical protein